MRALLVAVSDIFTKYSFEVTVTQDEHPVKAFDANRPHPALRVGIGPRRSDWRLDDPDAFGAEHLGEAGGEPGVPIPDRELDGSTSVGHVTLDVARHLGDKRTCRMVGDTKDLHLSSRQFDHEEHVELLE
jgi:hypothetical protein